MPNIPKTVAIIGNGCAAAECILALRQKGWQGKICLFADNAEPVANPMLTTYYASGRIDYETMFPYGNDFYRQNGMEFHPNEPVLRLDAAGKKVHTASGEHDFDCCLIASGASAVLPPLPGVDLPEVLTVRTVKDAQRLKEASGAKRVLVVGASMVGIKVVEMFHRLGAHVVLADMAPYIFPLAASQECARRIEARLLEKGIELRFSAKLLGLERAPEGGVLARFEGADEPTAADCVAMCAGVRPNLGFLSGEEIDVARGVLVNEHMCTNVPGIYAAGDVAQGRNVLSGEKQIIGLLASARAQGRAAGLHMLGLRDRQYEGGLPHNITHFMGMDFVGIGDVLNAQRTERWEKDGQFVQLFFRDGKLCGFNSLDHYTESGVVKNSLLRSCMDGAAGVLPGQELEMLEVLPQLNIMEKIYKGDELV